MNHPALRCVLVALLIGGTTAVGQQQTDLSQLKAKMQQLEQMMGELKKEIAAAEQVQKTPGAPLVAVKPAEAQVPPPLAPTGHIGQFTRACDLSADNSEGLFRINNEPMDPALRGYFRLPGTGTLIKLGGFVKTDLFVDLNQAGTFYGLFVPATFPSSSSQPKSMDFTVSMRASRFFTEFRQSVGDGSSSVKAYLEYDFLGAYDRTSFRMRQFYAQYKNLLVGQTWSSFGDPDAWPPWIRKDLRA